jgi:Zn ribbon nucleic-acid-binding protein
MEKKSKKRTPRKKEPQAPLPELSGPVDSFFRLPIKPATPAPLQVPAVPTDKPAVPGLECPACGCRHLIAVWTKPHKRGRMRRRDCRNCGKQIRSIESVLFVDP